MTDRTTPPFRADHVGSLLRPERLHNARASHESGALDTSALKAVEDECINEAVSLQEEVGLQSVTDGEFRRKTWHYDFLCSLDGIEQSTESLGPSFQGGHNVSSLAVTGKIGNPDGVMLDHFAYLKTATNATPKFCIPSPSLVYLRGGRALMNADAYPDMDGFWEDLAAAYRREVEFLSAAGCTYLQLDDTTFAMLCDPKVRQNMADRGDEPNQMVEAFGKGISEALKDRPAGMAVTIHMCRGNFQSSWIAEGGYEPVAEAMFAGVPVDGFFMEWDDDRAGGFEPLRFVPDDKFVILGLVTTKQAALESKDDLKRCIDEAAQYMPLERLCLSPQCGFASTVEGNKITHDDQRRKLALVVETAAEVWG